ncbi:vesicle transport through interaction with t-SNAREs homolog 1A isoform X1 [Patella vulgata]|uniref:vesicle transport through interaction with t-SNAREs homolog 1A isoform X1 n=2 Tax=Patella vulgata TaxID=6465 RepID=UPI0021800A4B|nr:vesicle transport through interaction with t-SNAREs homolog 1A isoform X1 [Patella vulgata]
MASLLESYEQQYSGVTADITYNIGRISNSHGAEKQTYIRQADKLFDEASELLEQMDLEINDHDPQSRKKYQTRIKSYKTEMGKLQKDLKRAKLGIDANRDELLGEDTHDSEDQRTRLLDNSERLERSSKRLDHGYKVVLETEQIGTDMLENLNSQRQQITRSRNRLEEMNSNLGKSSRVLSGMMKRIIQNRLLLLGIFIFIVLIIIVAIYFTVKRHT